MRGVRGNGSAMGPSTHLSDLWRDAVLRLVTEPARQ